MDKAAFTKKPETSTGEYVAGTTLAICFAVALIMLTIKLGMVLFG